MRINLTSVLVDDQEQPRVFCADTLGFVFKHDIPMGADRWLTVVSPQDPHGTELPLKLNPAAARSRLHSSTAAPGLSA